MWRQHAEHYLSPTGWSDEPADAVLRIRARFSAEAAVHVDNEIERRDDDGNWRRLDDAEYHALTPAQQGWVWTAWPSAAHGQPIVQLRGVRALTADECQTLFEDLAVLDPDGLLLPKPELAGLAFALSPQDAEIFAGRLRARGGALLAAAAELGGIEQCEQDAKHAATALEGLAAQGESVVVAWAQSGVTAGMDQLAASEGEVRTWLLRARHAATQAEPVLGALETAGKPTAELVQAAQRARAVMLALARAERAASRHRAARRSAAVIAGGAAPDAAPGRIRALLERLAVELVEDGQRAAMSGDALVVKTDDGEIRLQARRTR